MECQFDFNEDPQFLAPKIKSMLKDVLARTRADMSRLTEPHAQTLFETTADVLKGLVRAYERYEDAWQQ
jgi:hypothetical protein